MLHLPMYMIGYSPLEGIRSSFRLSFHDSLVFLGVDPFHHIRYKSFLMSHRIRMILIPPMGPPREIHLLMVHSPPGRQSIDYSDYDSPHQHRLNILLQIALYLFFWFLFLGIRKGGREKGIRLCFL